MFYACLVLQFRLMASLQRDLGTNPTLMRIYGFQLKPDRKGKIQESSKSVFSCFWNLLGQVELEHDAVCVLFNHNRD